MSCTLATTLPLIAPCLCLVYFLSVYGMYVSMHEFTWTSRLGSLSTRIALMAGAVASSMALCNSQADLKSVIPVGVASALISLYFMVETRRNDVVGNINVQWSDDHLRGKVVLITGANTGIGKETARQLASIGATVILACRSEARARVAMDDIRQASGGKIDRNKLIFLPLDLGDFESVRLAVKKFEELKCPSLDVLINNAGVMMGKKTVSKDGLELMMQANHLGHFLLTTLLLPHLQVAEGGARIINVSSSTHALVPGRFDFQDTFCDSERNYTLFGQYAMTKLANILFTKELDRRCNMYQNIPSLQAFAVHPGIVRTDVTRNMLWYMRVPNYMFAFFVSMMQKTPGQGAYCSVYCAASQNPPVSGSYVSNCVATSPSDASLSQDDAKRLWEVSQRITAKIKGK